MYSVDIIQHQTSTRNNLRKTLLNQRVSIRQNVASLVSDEEEITTFLLPDRGVSMFQNIHLVRRLLIAPSRN